MDQTVKLLGAALTQKGKYMIFLASNDAAASPMGARAIDDDAIRLLLPEPVSKREDAKELEARLHRAITGNKQQKVVKILLHLITVEQLKRIRVADIRRLPASLG
ncbi:hypothetical protein [Craterilacuibacter sp. RT1T]|uniref:hypothetical protein n=1 Tax=Craterilacuibacter sp. RT1T TaxID=2942211 RepID=UPI0020C10B57|nr:hypothetical protein [Craterilacuibacter sp. RT1T]MCL6262806.1 hypothetical protein [Craterilacuibacter sp. RT1T]